MSTIKLLPLAALLFLPCLAPGVERRANVAAPERELAALMPADTLVFIEAPGLAELARQGLEHPFVGTLVASDLGRALLARAPAPPAELLAAADRAVGFEVLPALASLSSHGVALGVVLHGAKPSWILAARGDDARRWRSSLERALALAAEKSGHPGALDRPATTIDGADAWKLGDELVLALRGASFVASNDAELVRGALERERSAEEPSSCLASLASFRAASNARAASQLARGWIDLAGLAALEERADPKHESERKIAQLRAIASQPAAQFLLGASLCSIGRASTLSLSLALDGKNVALALRADGIDAGAAAALLPSSPAPALPALDGRTVATAVLHRDAAALFAKRAELFPAATLPGFSKATSDLALLLGGMDLGDDVLPGLGPWVRVVVRPVAFEDALEPEIPLPAAALLVELKDPATLGPHLVGAFQTAIGLVNVDRAQKAQDSLLLEVKPAGELQVTTAHFHRPRAGAGVDLRYNLAPACALAGHTFVIGTHAALVEELARAELASASSSGASGTTSERLELAGPALAAVVDANAEALVMNGVLKEGKTREKAEGDVRGLIGVLRLVQAAHLELSASSASEVELRARFDLAPERK